MKERRKDTKKQKEERRHRDVLKYKEGFDRGYKEGQEDAKKGKWISVSFPYEVIEHGKEGAKECGSSLNGLQGQEGIVIQP